jgi:hypothetical protein
MGDDEEEEGEEASGEIARGPSRKEARSNDGRWALIEDGIPARGASALSTKAISGG